jgi:ketosteroid isomerase-like protein
MRNAVTAIGISLVLALTLSMVGPVAASEKTDALVPVHQFIDGFNKDDAKSVAAACVDDASLIDEFPPHEWHGPGACAKWLSDGESFNQANAVTDLVVVLRSPLRVDITGDRAYVVGRGSLSYKMKGKAEKETGSVYTFALLKGPDGWRITGFAWSRL